MLNILKNDYVNCFGYTFFEVASGSMGDAISINDMVFVKIDSDYEVGDIITYYSDGDFVTHRVVSIDNDKVITRGDANKSNDNPINDSVILGKVVFILDDIGVWKKVFMTPKVFISLIITLFLFSFTFSYNNRSVHKKNKKINKKNVDNSVNDIYFADPDIPFIEGGKDS